VARRPAAKTRIQRAGSGHAYYLDGEKCPGVTTIIGNGVPKNGLIGWSARMVSDFVVNHLAVATTADGRKRIVADELVADALAWNATRGTHAVRVSESEVLPRGALGEILSALRYRDSDAAANRGTQVHKLAADLAAGAAVEVPEELRGHVENYVKFLDQWDPRGALVERVVVNRTWRYMGRLDLVATFPGRWPSSTPWAGEPVGTALLDVKTSRSGVFAETGLQLAGYRYAETMLDGLDDDGEAIEVPMPKVDWCGVVHVRADGFDVYRFDVTEKTHRVFLYVKKVGEWLDFKEGAAATIKSDALPAPRRDEE
jgi:hypothetical protein